MLIAFRCVLQFFSLIEISIPRVALMAKWYAFDGDDAQPILLDGVFHFAHMKPETLTRFLSPFLAIIFFKNTPGSALYE